MAARKRRSAPAEQAQESRVENAAASTDDTAHNYLTPVERERLSIDSWEPSLLRQLLEAENRLPRKR
jgi:hypothetical protein